MSSGGGEEAGGAGAGQGDDEGGHAVGAGCARSWNETRLSLVPIGDLYRI